MSAKLTIIYTTKKEVLSDDPPMRGVISADVTDASVYDWFRLFEWALSAAGFNEDRIAEGACQLAFNERRRDEILQHLYSEYELGDFSSESDEPQEEAA
tara:strand:+ start:637 stop:933 length:297 start_codon:yes stop_codon:yes gene_type:complete